MTPSEIARAYSVRGVGKSLFMSQIRDIIAERDDANERLKIATEALEKMVVLYESEQKPENLKRPQWLVCTLARIKATNV